MLEYPEDSWRDIQIHSNQTSDELGAAVLAAFEAKGGHQWNLETSDAYFEYNLDSETAEWQRQRGAVVIGEPDDKSIGDLDFKVDEQLVLQYDYGTTWSFLLTVTKLEPVSGAKQGAYPCVSAGCGPRMVEDVAPFALQDLMEYQKNGETIDDHPEFEGLLGEEDLDWRYDEFSLDELKKSFQGNYGRMRDAYRRSASSRDQNVRDRAFLLKALTTLDHMANNMAEGRPKKKKSAAKPAAKPSAPKIFTFRFESAQFPHDFWREVEITSEATVGDLATAVLAAFDTEPDHLWSLFHKGFKYYHYPDDDNPYYGRKEAAPVHAYEITLGELGLRARSRLEMKYDYFTPWYFNLRVVASRPQTEHDDSADYPRLIAGDGMPLVDSFPMELNWAINNDLKHGRNLKDDNVITAYIDDVDEYVFPEFDLEEAVKKFPSRAETLSAMYSTGTPY